MGIVNSSRFNTAIAEFDRLNAQDPNKENFAGTEYPKELLYSQRMTAQLKEFCPNASEALQLAARCQHIQRWTIPRTDYPAGRQGYKKWRTDLAKYHAQTAARILENVGYDPATISRVKVLLTKQGLKADKDVQTLEDVICLVFLQYYADDFAAKHDEAKVMRIVRKTLKKMSPAGRKAAETLSLSSGIKAIVRTASL